MRSNTPRIKVAAPNRSATNAKGPLYAIPIFVTRKLIPHKAAALNKANCGRKLPAELLVRGTTISDAFAKLWVISDSFYRISNRFTPSYNAWLLTGLWVVG